MSKIEYEKLLKRIQNNLSEDEKESKTRFELPPVDVMWEGQRTFLRNFSEYPKVLLGYDLLAVLQNGNRIRIAIVAESRRESEHQYDRE